MCSLAAKAAPTRYGGFYRVQPNIEFSIRWGFRCRRVFRPEALMINVLEFSVLDCFYKIFKVT